MQFTRQVRAVSATRVPVNTGTELAAFVEHRHENKGLLLLDYVRDRLQEVSVKDE